MIQKLLLCTGNQGKVDELRAMLPEAMEVIGLAAVNLPPDLPENGDTLKANALEKAKFAFDRTGIPCLADDTGLEVDVFNGEPGVYSARYAGEAKDPVANMEKLLKAMEGQTDRKARFRTVLALVDASGELTFEGVIEGSIAHEPRGRQGFGYDPVFVPEGSTASFAEMDKAAKNAIGHRGQAMRKLAAHLASL